MGNAVGEGSFVPGMIFTVMRGVVRIVHQIGANAEIKRPANVMMCVTKGQMLSVVLKVAVPQIQSFVLMTQSVVTKI